MGYTHIDENERRRIERAQEAGKSIRTISRMLGRSVGSISLEVRRNSVRGMYRADRAKAKAHLRRRFSKMQCMKVAMEPELRMFVTENIAHDQSPEAISGRLKHVEVIRTYASTKAIYKFVHSVHGRKIEKHLYSKAVKKKGGPKRGTRKTSIDGRITIDQRPKSVEKRKEFGHFEGDFIESGRDGKGSLLVLVERKTRYPFLVYTDDKSTAHINELVAKTLHGISVASITLDNDLSFQKHEALSELIEATVFFCHPYCSHEKGTIENRNRAVRRYVPKKTNLSSVSIETFKEIEKKLRTRYMKCLNFQTPEEAWRIEMEKVNVSRKPPERATVSPLSASIIQKSRCST